MLERELASLLPGPVQQPVRVEGVVDAAALVQGEREPDLLAARAYQRARALRLFGGCSVFLGQCSVMSWPSGGICGLSSNGWKWISVFTSSPSCAIACSNALSPITHQDRRRRRQNLFSSAYSSCGLARGCHAAFTARR